MPSTYTSIAAFNTANKALLDSIRVRSLAGEYSGSLQYPGKSFAGATLTPEAWECVTRIERLLGEIDHYLTSARSEWVEEERLRLPRTTEAMESLNQSIAWLTEYLAAKGVTFTFAGSLPLK